MKTEKYKNPMKQNTCSLRSTKLIKIRQDWQRNKRYKLSISEMKQDITIGPEKHNRGIVQSALHVNLNLKWNGPIHSKPQTTMTQPIWNSLVL